MGKELVFHATIHVAPENVEAFLQALRPAWEGCRREPECLFFEVMQDPETPGLLRFVEVWSKDKEWFLKVGPFVRECSPRTLSQLGTGRVPWRLTRKVHVVVPTDKGILWTLPEDHRAHVHQ